MSMGMTGRERQEYAQRKTECEHIDQACIKRHQNDAGKWRREWDHKKAEWVASKQEWENKHHQIQNPY